MNLAMNNKRKHIKDIANTLLILAIIIVINIIGKTVYFRADLTKEKRYTLSEESIHILENLNDEVFIHVYLDGELNIQLTNFQKNIIETLEEFRIHAGNNLHYELSDPFEGVDIQTQSKIMEELYHKGLRPTNIHHRKKDGSVTEKIIIPGIILSFNGVEIPLNLLLNNPSKSSGENLNNSIESLEYTLISSIKNITSSTIDKVAFIEGHGEWPEIFVSDIMQELSKSYQVDRGVISGTPGILDPYSCIIIAGPVSTFSEPDKFVIDQYLMQGGKVLWLVDGANVDYDSLASGLSIALPNELNLEDMLFRYGVRINPNILRDAQCGALKVNVALAGNKPDFQLAPWVYYPVLSPSNEHVVTSNLNLVLSRFASSLDTIEGRTSLKKHPILSTSPNSSAKEVPVVIALEEINTPPSEAELNQQNLMVGVLLEGEFESVFKNRMLDNYFTSPPANRLDKSVDTRMAVIADADIIKNDIAETEKGPSILPLGYDRATNQTFGNKDLIVNVINYLINDTNLLSLRGREFKLRLLDNTKLQNNRVKWQLINIILPILFVIVIGIGFNKVRKNIYTR